MATYGDFRLPVVQNPPPVQQKWQNNGKLGEFMPNFRLTLLTKL